MYFAWYDSELSEISDTEFYSGDWAVYGEATGDDGEAHTILISRDRTRLAYWD